MRAADGGHSADGFGHFVVAITEEAEGGVVQRDAGGVIPAALGELSASERQHARGVVKVQRGRRTGGDGADVAGARRIHEGAPQAAGGEDAEGFKRAAGERATEVEGAAAVDRGAARVVLIHQQGDGATSVARARAVSECTEDRRADDHAGRCGATRRVGQDVGICLRPGCIKATEVEEFIAPTKTVSAVRTHAQGRCIVGAALTDGVLRGAEPGRAIADFRKINGLDIEGVDGQHDGTDVLAKAVHAAAEEELRGVLRTAEAVHVDVQIGEREVITGDAENAVVRHIALKQGRASPAAREVPQAVELDGGLWLDEDAALTKLGGVVEGGIAALKLAEIGGAAGVDVTHFRRRAVAIDVEFTALLVECAAAGLDRAADG